MEFAQPRWLWLLLIAPAIAGMVSLSERRRRIGWRRLALPGRPPADGGMAGVIASILLVVALAQPRWGRAPGEPLPPGRDVVLLVDVSWSMAAEDVIPNRLGRAVSAAEDLTRSLGSDPGDRVGLVAFAGRGVVRCPLTTNLGAVIEALRTLRPGAVEPGGSDLGAGLDTAIGLLDDEPRAGGRIVVAFSDGEDHLPGWLSRVDRLRELGVVVHTVAIGDDSRGHPIPVASAGPDGRPGPLTVDGQVVLSRREDTELRGLSLATGGAFIPVGISSADLAELYRSRIAPVERRAREGASSPERVERFRVVVFLALAVGLIGSWPRRRRPATARPWWRSWTLLGLAILGVSGGAGTDRPQTAPEAIEEGRRAFDRGDFPIALDRFDRAAELAPGDPVPVYNAASTLYQLGRFEEALDRYRAARRQADPALRTKIDYALGNTAVALRDIPAALSFYDDCLSSSAPGDDLDRIRRFARDNRAFAERLASPGSSTADGPGRSTGPEGPDPGDSPGREPGDDAPGSSGDRPGPSPPGSPSGSSGSPGEDDAGGTAAVPGSSSARSPGRGDSPSDRLAQAVESIQQAKDRRLPDRPPSPPADRPDRPGW
ncbi:vWA domain-containing protein [Tautonia sociabilis]|uniref:vWA domain-containing protein n=1 Tax=Tautonia sociabilis TaxID=2080755 RepID=UPI0013158365|nr:vWA domain-containing protein [Tautonia sociabilis]